MKVLPDMLLPRSGAGAIPDVVKEVIWASASWPKAWALTVSLRRSSSESLKRLPPLIPAGYLPYPLQRISQIRGPNVGTLPWLGRTLYS